MRKTYKAITIDVYGTLLIQDLGFDGFQEVCSVCPMDRETVYSLGRAFEPELREQFKTLLDRDFTHEEPFPTLQSLFEATFRRLGLRYYLDLDTETLSQRLAHRLAKAPAFPEAGPVLEQLRRDYPICFVSDGDTTMVRGALSFNGLDRFPVVISEQLRAYKISPNTPLFRRALEILGTTAEETIHVGDQASDVYGAHQSGLDCVYVNRAGRSLPAGVPPPTLEVSDLQTFAAWLTGEMDPSCIG